jgi:hypothetical protein
MRLHRVALVAAWITVSLIAVVGFAGFSARQNAPQPEVTASVAPRLGNDAGAASAMAFVYPHGGTASLRSRSPAETVPETTVADEEGRTSTTVERTSTLTESEVRSLVGGFFLGEDVARALRSAWCASTFNPAAVNSATGAGGLFQIDSASWEELSTSAGVPDSNILDPTANTRVAAWVVYNVEGGWSNLACSG